MRNVLLDRLREEKSARLKGGVYQQTQIKLCYNSNRIEGSRLSEEQTRYIYETNAVHTAAGETANVDDIIETVNHFAAFDYLLTVAETPPSENIVKEFHRLLKTGTAAGRHAPAGEYKNRPNTVGGIETAAPDRVARALEKLLRDYSALSPTTFADIVGFHYEFEKIHPFQDGNGRVGRLVIFKECLRHNVTPLIIADEHKLFYYRGLKEFPVARGYLLDTCRAAQDDYAAMMSYFGIPLGESG
ncbi:MAG: Fic family protein [Planctomycetota bacterium]|jgi:Fic family protein|nr:Fic family protein [Planctomycetota bacterium]